MDTIRISDTGSSLLVTGLDRNAVQAALDGMVARGSSVVSPPSQLGTKWVASCSKPTAQVGNQDPSNFDDVIRDAVWASVKVEDAGTKLIVTGKERAPVERALQLLSAHGGGAITPVAPFGSGWIGSCANPQAEVECSVERVGLQMIVLGPTEAAIREKLRQLQVGGAKVVHETQLMGDKYVMVCEMPHR
ncbi:MAG TPA: hypothetical protein VFN70_05940 [Burkholderiales bacterium]|nr:hypothetical protein [Burkholderiales bacterium]